MLILTKSVLAVMISFLLSVCFGAFFVPFLKNRNASQRLSVYLREKHKKKIGTPTMGGFIFIIPSFITLFILFVMGKIKISYNLLILVFTIIGYTFIGFIDDYLIIKRNNNKGLTERQKLFLQIFVATIFFYLFMKAGNEPLLWIHSLSIKYDIGWLYGLFILFVLVASSNAVNLTDGLDGLAGGLSLIAYLTFGVISWMAGWLEGYEEIAIYSFILVGSILGFLVYNVSPAKVFMGDTGSLPLGAGLGSIAILTRHELLLVLIGITFVIETVSCILQIIYYKLTHKRLFPMTPIHHTFEKIGWNERDIVKLFWIVGLFAAMISIVYGVWI